jgi:hypothetical protein
MPADSITVSSVTCNNVQFTQDGVADPPPTPTRAIKAAAPPDAIPAVLPPSDAAPAAAAAAALPFAPADEAGEASGAALPPAPPPGYGKRRRSLQGAGLGTSRLAATAALWPTAFPPSPPPVPINKVVVKPLNMTTKFTVVVAKGGLTNLSICHLETCACPSFVFIIQI